MHLVTYNAPAHHHIARAITSPLSSSLALALPLPSIPRRFIRPPARIVWQEETENRPPQQSTATTKNPTLTKAQHWLNRPTSRLHPNMSSDSNDSSASRQPWVGPVHSATYEPVGVGSPPTLSPQAVKFGKLVFLGTGSAVPSPGRRNTSGLAVQLTNSTTILMDCGEGTQHQIMRSQSISFVTIRTILITHLHGDHCFGLFGLLCSMATNGRSEPVTIVGPIGIRRMVETVLGGAGGFHAFQLQFLELEEGQVYNDLGKFNEGIRVSAYPLTHGISSFGYVLEEALRPGVLYADRAKELGAQGPQLAALKQGKDVTLKDGRVVRSAEVVAPPLPAKRLALLQDTRDSELALPACHGIDLLIHESTYSHALHEKALDHGHSTAKMVGEFAARCQAKMIVLTHFSNRYETKEQTKIRELEQGLVSLGSSNQSVTTASSSSISTSSSNNDNGTTASLTLRDLVHECMHAYTDTHPSHQPPSGGVHAAEDFMQLECNLREGWRVLPQSDIKQAMASDAIPPC